MANRKLSSAMKKTLARIVENGGSVEWSWGRNRYYDHRALEALTKRGVLQRDGQTFTVKG